MRPNADPERIRELVRELARTANEDTTIYLTGGPYSQALSKISRDFELDRADVEAMIEQGLVDPRRLEELFEQIEPDLFRYPSLDAADFRSKLERALDR